MTLKQLTKQINEYIAENSFLRDFQYYRRQAKNKKGGNNDFFTPQTTFKSYAFHYGGRSEMQFNIGEDENLFRYGLAFSLESSQSLPAPEIELKSSILKFNKYIGQNYEQYRKLKMWNWSDEGRSEIMQISEIPTNWIKKGNFIFIGEFIEKEISSIDPDDIKKIVESFEYLFGIYRNIELKSEKIAKICWNLNGWIKPSGRTGKSKSDGSYEKEKGFGHEEWLFDFDKIVNGYHYAAIQPIGRYQQRYTDCFFDILLYTYNSDTKEWYWVAKLLDVHAITIEEAESVYNQYKDNGWLSEMMEDLKKIGANTAEIDTYNQYTFNIKFKPKDVEFFNGGLKPFSEKEKISHNRYTLLNIDQIKTVPVNYKNYEILQNENRSQRVNTFTRTFNAETKEYSFIHGKLQDLFFTYLKKKFPEDEISKEARLTGLNRSIDIYQKKSDGSSVIYEIKSYSDIKTSLRIALGQLLEYAYYPDRRENIGLILVTHLVADTETKKYIENLNRLFKLNIGIVGFDCERKRIIDKHNYDNGT